MLICFSVHSVGGLWETSILELIFSSQNWNLSALSYYLISVTCTFSLAKAQFLYKFLTFCKCTGKKGKKVVRGVVALSPHQVIIPTSFFRLEYPCTKAEVKWRMCLLRRVDLDLKVNVLGSHPALSCVLSDLRAHPVPGCLWHSWGCVWGWAWDMTLRGPIGSLQGLSHTFVFGAVAVLSLPSFPNKTGFPQNV